MTAWSPQQDRELGEYTPVEGDVDFPRIPVSRGRYPNMIVVASGASRSQTEARRRVTAELATALHHIGRSVLIWDGEDAGDAYECLGVTSETHPIRFGTRSVARSGLWARLPMARPGIWVAGSHAGFASQSERNLRRQLRMARSDCDFVIVGVSPDTPRTHRYAFNGGLFLVVDPESGPLLSTTAIRAVVRALRLADVPELCMILRDPRDGTDELRAATYRLGTSGPTMAASRPLPPGDALADDGFDPAVDARARRFVELADAIVNRSGEQAPGPVVEAPILEPSTGSTRRPDLPSPAETRRRSTERSSDRRCNVGTCRRRSLRKSGFCERHLPEHTRVARFAVSWSRLEVRWDPRCQAPGCWSPALDTHCWDHERHLHPERMCRVPGCEQRAEQPERGGAYCSEHDKVHNPYYPYTSKRRRLAAFLLIATFSVVMVSLVLWCAVFGIRWFAAHNADCATGAFEWTWFGPRCHVTSDELSDASTEARRAAFATYDAELDRRYDELIAECAELAITISRDPQGRFMVGDATEACIYSGMRDLEDWAKEADERIDDAARLASAELYEERTGLPYPYG